MLRTVRAWAIKEAPSDPWAFSSWSEAKNVWLRWYSWAIRSCLDPIKQVARMVKTHLVRILNAVVTGVSMALVSGNIHRGNIHCSHSIEETSGLTHRDPHLSRRLDSALESVQRHPAELGFSSA